MGSGGGTKAQKYTAQQAESAPSCAAGNNVDQNKAASAEISSKESQSFYNAVVGAGAAELKQICDAKEKVYQDEINRLKEELFNLQKVQTESHGTFLVKQTARQDEAHREGEHNEVHLPPELREFIPFSKMEAVLKACEGLKELETAVTAAPSDAEEAAKFRAKLVELRAVYETLITSSQSTENIVCTCDSVIRVGNQDFEQVYAAVWSTIESSEPEGIVQCKESLKLLQSKVQGTAEQRTSDPVELYADAATAKTLYNPFMDKITQLHGHVTLMCPDSLKKSSRIMEKSLLRPDKPAHCERVCDIVRAMVVASSMPDVAKLLDILSNSAGVVIVRIKDRFFTTPSAGGWRDIMLNFYMLEDPAQHVCEIQLVHKTMLTARKGLPGHVIYGRVRNASEILESLQLLPETRAERARQLRSQGTPANELLRLGCQLDILVAAGYDLVTLRSLALSDEALKDAGMAAAEFRAHGTSLRQLRDLGFSAGECESLGFGAQQLLSVGYAVGDLKNKGSFNVAVGVLLLDYDIAADVPSTIDFKQFGYPSFFERVPCLTFDVAASGTIPPNIEQYVEQIVEKFTKNGVSMITGEIGVMIFLTPVLRKYTDKPLVMSPLSLLPSVAAAFGTNAGSGNLAIFTMSKEILIPVAQKVEEETGCKLDFEKFLTFECMEVPGMEAVAMGEPLDVKRMIPMFVGYVKHVIASHSVRAILMEDPALCAFSSVIRIEIGLPVFDVITACDLCFILQQPRQEFA